MSERAALAAAFLQGAGWQDARRQPLAGDASDRSYERLSRGSQSAVLMDAPPGQGDDPSDFLRIGRHLAALGLRVPTVLAQDLPNGFLLLEDFGDALFARLIAMDPGRELPLCSLATDALVHLARAPLPPGLPDLSANDWAMDASLCLVHYAEPLIGPTSPATFVDTLTDALRRNAEGPRIFIHRDFHAENLILLPADAPCQPPMGQPMGQPISLRQIGLLDFQLGQAGQPGYDLVSLLQDARRDVALTTEKALVNRYAAALNLDNAAFSARYATLGAQRALRILGIFARLACHSEKPRYLPMIPRVWGQLQRNLAHPALSDLRAACAVLPAPTAENLTRLATG